MKKICIYIENKVAPLEGYEAIDIESHALQEIPATSCSNIVVHDTLDFVPDKNILQLIVTKLAYGGELVMSGIDLRCVCEDFSSYKTTIQEAHHWLYNGRINTSTLETYIEILEKFGLKIIKQILYQGHYNIIAKRPEPENVN